jgi:GT2 family glycosyltransferase
MGIVGSTVRFYDAPEFVQALGGGRLNRFNAYSSHIGEGSPISEVPTDGSLVERELAFVAGASMLVSTPFIRDIGLMQDDYFLYYEEIDWATRGLDRYRLGYAPRSHIFHKSGANSSKIMPLFTAGFFYRNRLRFVRRFLPDRMAAAKRKLFEEMLRHLARGRWGLARVVWSTLLAPPKN